jgi:teichuronic acid biosynthesis glycosyltransferase TuaG
MLVSIITPAFNAARTIKETIRSVQSQTFKDWELIIVDDGSTDETRRIAEEEATMDRRLRVVSDQNSGVAIARNRGMALANGRYMAFLDADDVWLPRKLELQLEFMQRTGEAFSCTAWRRFWDDGKLSALIPAPPRVEHKNLLKSRPIGFLTVVVDRQKVEPRMPNIFRTGLPEDLITFLEILRGGNHCVGLNVDLARYRVTPGSRSSRKILSALSVWRVYRDFEGLPVWTASWYFANYGVNAAISSMRYRGRVT